jgi:hypothetical protein
MHRSTVGGYQGPVEVLTPEDAIVAQAACRYRAEADASAIDHWKGRLHRIDPPEAVTVGQYRLRFPNGQTGDVTIEDVTPGSQVVYFEGIGNRPAAN